MFKNMCAELDGFLNASQIFSPLIPVRALWVYSSYFHFIDGEIIFR